MANAVELATGYITLAVETKSLGRDLGRQFAVGEKIATGSGRRMGQAMSQAFEQAQPDLDSLRKEVETAEAKITASVERNAKKQEDAKRKVEIAQAKANEALAKYGEGSSQALTAIDRLVTAEQKLEAASMAARAEQEKFQNELEQTREALNGAQSAAEQSAAGTEKAFKGIGGRIKAALSGDFKGAFSGVEGDAASSADGVAQEFTAAGDDAAEGFGDKFLGGLKGIAGAAAGLGIGLSVAEGLSSGMERERLGDKLAAQLALTGPDAKRAGDVAGSLYAGAWGESMDDTHNAVQAVMSSIPGMMDAPQASLESTTAKAMDLATAFDVDINESVGAVGVMLRNGLAKDADAAFDLMVGGMQKVPAGFRDELMPAMTEYGKHFAALGMDGATAMGLLVRGAENGTIGVDKMGDAVKEFQIRSTDMSDATQDAYDAIGVDMGEMTDALLAGGDTAEGAMGKIVHGLQGITDPGEQAAAAIALFGTPLEDISVDQIPEFLGMMDPAGDAFDDFGGAAERMGDTLNNNAATNLESFKRTIGQGFTEVVGTAAGKLMDLGSAFKPVGDWLAKYSGTWGPFATGVALVTAAVVAWTAATAIQTLAQTALASAAWATMAAFAPWVIGIGLAVGAVIWAYKNVEWFRDLVDGAWGFIKDSTAALVDWWTETAFPAVVTALEWLGDAFSKMWDGIVSGAEWVSGAFSKAWDAITGTIDTVAEKFRSGVDAIKQVWSSLVHGDFVGTGPLMEDSPIIGFIFDLREAISGAIGWIKGAISNVADWFSNTIVPNFHKSMNALGMFFDFLYRNFIAPFVWLFKMAVLAVSAFFRDTVVPIFRKAIDSLGEKFRWLNENVIQPVWSWVQRKIQAVVSWFANTLVPWFRRAVQVIGDQFKWFRDTIITPVWNFVQSKIRTVTSWFANTLVPWFRGAVQSIADKFNWFKNNVITPVWNWVQSKIRTVVNWFRDTIVPAFRAAIQRVTDKFTAFKSGVNTVWEGLKGLLKRGWEWVNTNVFDPIKSGLDKLKDSFTRTKDGIGDAWDKLRAKVRKPIDAVVTQVINPFLTGYNKINNAWDGTNIGPLKGWSDGYARGGVIPGYQSAKKDDRLIPMRSGEGVLVPEAVRGIGAEAVHALNKAGNTGGATAARNAWAAMHNHDNPGNAAIGARVYGAQSFVGPSFDAIARTGELNVAGSAPGWSLPTAIRMADAATTIKVKRGNGNAMNGVTARTMNAPQVPWDGYFYHDDGSISLNNARAMGYPALTRQTITAHEIGHALGLPHAMSWQGGNGARSIMNYDTMLKDNKFMPSDIAALSAIYGGTGKSLSSNGDSDSIDVLDFLKDKLGLDKLANKASALKSQFVGNTFSEMPLGIFDKLKTGAVDFAKSKLLDLGGFVGDKIKGGASIAKVTAWMTKALIKKGMFSPTHLKTGVARAMHESSGDPNAIQGEIGDVNNLTGNLARGLMQVVPTTFEAHKEPGHDNIFDPIDNILASINYTVKAWGSLQNGWGDLSRGYATGGIVGEKPTLFDGGGLIHEGVQLIDHQRSQPDRVLTARQWDAMYRTADSVATTGGSPLVQNLYAFDADEAMRKLALTQKKREVLANAGA